MADHAPVAQRIEHLPSKQRVVRSSRTGRTKNFMAGVAQVVRAPGCGPGGRGFKSHFSPHFMKKPIQTDGLFLFDISVYSIYY